MSGTAGRPIVHRYAHPRGINEFAVAELPVELYEGKSCALEDRLRAFEERVRDFDLEVVFGDLMGPQVVGSTLRS